MKRFLFIKKGMKKMNYPLLEHKMPERIKKVWRWTWLVETIIALLLGGVAFLIYHFI